MKSNTLTLNPWFLIKNFLLLFATLVIAFLLQSTILVSPSHPFIDENGNGIDDFEESAGKYADPNVKAQVYGVTFPIADLGNCGSYSECRSYCEDPLNQSACINYAKSKGFYQGESDEKIKTVLSRAKGELGCDSEASCLNFCEIPANFAKCSGFAQKHDLSGGYVDDPSKTQVISKAKEVLGCDSEVGCQSLCSKEENRQKCSEFAKTVGLHGGEQRVGPGGCTSEATCKAFCSDPNNYQICSGFTEVAGGKFKGPGGCDSEESCRNYCQQNEDECRAGFGGPGPGGSPPPGYNPQEMCNRTPNCSWTSNTCQCGFYGETQESAKKAGEYAAFCEANPDKCKPGQPASFDNPQQLQDFEKYCRENPDRCKPPVGGTTGGGTYGGYSEDPAAACSRYGCSWTGSTCQCSGSSGQYSPAPGYSPQPGSTPPAGYTPPPYSGPGSYTPPSSGTYTPPSSGTYTPPPPSSGSYQQPSTGSYTPPSTTSTTESAPPPTTSTTESAPPPTSNNPPPPSTTESAPPPPTTQSAPPPPSGVQGVSTGLLQYLLDLLR